MLLCRKIIKNKQTRGGTRTRNLRFRRPTPYPLGHTGFILDEYLSAISNKKQLNKNKLQEPTPRTNFFTNRIANVWNILPRVVVEQKIINGFKNKLDQN